MMKKSAKAFLAALLAAVLILSAVPAAFAETPGRAFKKNGYLHVYAQGSTKTELVFVSTHRCMIQSGKYKEYFDYRMENDKLIFTNYYGYEAVTEETCDGCTVNIPLDNNKWVNLLFGRYAMYLIETGQTTPHK